MIGFPVAYANFDPEDVHDRGTMQRIVDNAMEYGGGTSAALFLKEASAEGDVLQLAFRADDISKLREGLYAGDAVDFPPVLLSKSNSPSSAFFSFAIDAVLQNDTDQRELDGMHTLAIPLQAYDHTAFAVVIVQRPTEKFPAFDDDAIEAVANAIIIDAVALGPINPEIAVGIADLDDLIANLREKSPIQEQTPQDTEDAWTAFEDDLVARFESDLKKKS